MARKQWHLVTILLLLIGVNIRIVIMRSHQGAEKVDHERSGSSGFDGPRALPEAPQDELGGEVLDAIDDILRENDILRKMEKDPGLLPNARLVRERLEVLAQETVQDSLEQLDFVDWYYHHRYSEGMGSLSPPLEPEAGIYDVLRIQHNRRFRKVYQELSVMPNSDASTLLAPHIEQTLRVYKSLFDRAWQGIEASAKGQKLDTVGSSMIIGNGPEGQPTLIGSQLDVLGLVWIAANLQLTETRPQVEAVLREALRQRDYHYSVEGDLSSDAMATLKRAGIYNRDILGTAIIELTPDCDAVFQGFEFLDIEGVGSGPPDFEKYMKAQREKKPHEVIESVFRTVPYDAAALGMNVNAVPVDWSKGSFDLRCLTSVDDSTFNALIEYAGCSSNGPG